MRRVTLDKLPVLPETRALLADNPDIAGAVVDRGTIQVFGPKLATKTLDGAKALLWRPTHAWERDWKPAPKRKPKPRTDGLSRTQAALKLIDEEDITPYAAAQQAGVDVSAVYRALTRREAKAKAPKCPCCQRPLPAETACAS